MIERVRRARLLAVAIVAGLLLLSVEALESPEFTREQEFRTRNGELVVHSSSLPVAMFKVSMNNRTIDVKSLTSSSTKPCKGIVIDPFEDAIEGEIRTAFIDSESKNKIVIWGVGRLEIVNASRTIGYTMLIVDLEECKSKGLALPDEQIPYQQRILLPEVQTGFYQKFYVYYASQRNCSPCEVDNYGLVRPTASQLPPEAAEPVDNFQLRPLDNGYLYAFNFKNGSAVVKLLKEYEPSRIRYLNHRVDVVCVKTGRIRNVGYCYQSTQSPNELRCERLDSRLQSRVPVLVALDQPARRFSLEFDEQANFFVAVILNDQVRVHVYAIYGELLTTLDFGSLQQMDRARDLRAYVDAEQYCLFYSIQPEASGDASNIVKCINKTRYVQPNFL